MNTKKKFKTFVIALVFAVGIIGIGSTVALLTSSDQIVNTFSAAEKVDTSIEEDVDDRDVTIETDILKKPYVINNSNVSTVIRARITVSPSDLDVTLKSGTWTSKTSFTQTGIVYSPSTGFCDVLDSSGKGWLYSSDGWYYYNVVTAGSSSNNRTTSLFDAVYLGKSVTEDDEIDIAISHEAISAGGHADGDVLDLETLEALFRK
jgi:predicted ribosomally synthesized peptide with SipW-like signal peptide